MDTFHERYRLAVKYLEIREGASTISNVAMVRRVAAEMGGESLTPSSASRWKSKAVPDLAILGAIARVCGPYVLYDASNRRAVLVTAGSDPAQAARAHDWIPR